MKRHKGMCSETRTPSNESSEGHATDSGKTKTSENENTDAQKVLDDNIFLNPVVVCRILEYIDTVKDLKIIRQVCQLWKTLSLEKWRSVATVVIHPNTTTTAENKYCTAEIFLQQFLMERDPNKLEEHPFIKYTLKGFNFVSGHNEEMRFLENKNTPNFWNSVGPVITYLEFDQCKFPGNHSEIFERIVSEKTVNLSCLVLSHNNVIPTWSSCLDGYSVVQYRLGFGPQFRKIISQNPLKRLVNLKTIKISGEAPTSLYRLLLNSPNVQSIHLSQVIDYKFEPLRTLYRIKMDRDKEPFQWKCLDLINVNAFENFRGSLEDIRLPLEHLSVTISPHSKTDELTALCRQYKDTLKILKVYVPPYNYAPSYSPFQYGHPMNSMTELYLYGNVISELVSLKYLPNLKILHVDPKSFDRIDMFRKMGRYPASFNPDSGNEMISTCIFNRGEQLEKMESFHLNTKTLMESELMARARSLAEWMPNLKTLETNLDMKGFRAVCKFLPRLEELVLLFESRIGDEAVTGIKGNGRIQNPMNITTFENLKKFQLKTFCKPDHNSDQFRLGDKSVYNGFLKLSTLQTVIISVSRKMTVAGEEDLKRHVAHVEIIRNYDDTHPHGECCVIKQIELELPDGS